MADQSLEATVARLADSTGGQIIAAARDGLQRSFKMYLFLFVLGFMVAFPFTSAMVEWLIDDQRLPDGVDIIVISPVEFIFLQLRVAGYAGLILVTGALVAQVGYYGVRHQEVQARLRELQIQLPLRS